MNKTRDGRAGGCSESLAFVNRIQRHLCAALSLLPIAPAGLGAERGEASFLSRYCLDCHDAETKKGGLDLSALSPDLQHGEIFERWVEVHDQAAGGAMPPVKAKLQPPDEARAKFVAGLDGRLSAADRERQDRFGRARLRRLNRVEYEAALSDLLGIPLHIREGLPPDARKDGFTTVGEALNLSAAQMEAYLETLDHVLDLATVRIPKPETKTWRMSYKETSGILQQYRREGPHLPVEDGVAMFGTELFAHFDATLEQFVVPHDGRYRIRVSARTSRSEEPITLTIRAGGVGRKESNHAPRWELAHQSVFPGEPQTVEWEGWLLRGHFLHIYPSSLRKMRFIDGEENRQEFYQGPGAVVQSVEVVGPILDEWPPRAHDLLYGGVALKPIPGAVKNVDLNDHLNRPPDRVARPWTVGDPKTRKWTQREPEPGKEEMVFIRVKIPPPVQPEVALASVDPKADARRLLARFLPLAFRREVAPDEAEPFVMLAHQWLDAGSGFESAMRAAYKLALTSPGFLYHQATLPAGSDKAGRLTDAALAERLAFFLWNSIPDAALREVAATGKLGDPEPLRVEVERMLADPRSSRFVNDFLDQWLDLRLIDFTAPDSDLYPEFDPLLRWSMIEETRAFFRELLEKDLSAIQLVDSSFAMLNDRLAQQYGIVGVKGFQLRRVALDGHSPRGGLLTQGGVLKVTANGATTSPVIRGVWVADRILGKPPKPQPPGAGAIEPDIRGATTIREQLAKHSSEASCAACHAAFDPYGFALESFDVIGGYRERYRILDPKKSGVIPRFFSHRPEVKKFMQGLPVEASGQFADGRAFGDVGELKKLLLSDSDQIVRNLIERLLIYSTGASLSYADRVVVDAILEKARAKGFGLRAIVHEVAQSEAFRRK